MKKILFALLTIALLTGCGNEKAQENALLDSVKDAHDKVMSDDDMTMKVKGRLKLLSAHKPELKDSITFYLKKLDDNDNVMMDWMNKFNPDFTGKSHEQIMSYLKIQKREVMQVDSQIKQGSHQAVDFVLRNSKK